MNKPLIKKIVIIIILMAVVYWIISGVVSRRQEETENKIVHNEKQLQIRKSVKDLVVKHNAITNWKNNLEKGRSMLNPAFTIEVNEALVREDGQPILLFATIEDIVEGKENYTIHFHNPLMDFNGGADIHFILACTHEKGKEIDFDTRRYTAKYAVIAQITKVRKIRYGVISDEYEKVSVGSYLPSNVFEAIGSCLDLLYVEYYKHEDFLEIPSK